MTDIGELVIHVSDSDVEVVVKKLNGEPVREMEFRRGVGKTSLYAGEYVIEIKGANANEFAIDNRLITLSRSEDAVVTIERKTAAQLTADDGRSGERSTREREAAEWVLALGGSVRILEAGKQRTITESSSIPRSVFSIAKIDFGFESLRRSIPDMDQLRGLPELTAINFGSTVVTGRELAELERLSGLTSVEIYRGEALSNEDLAHLGALRRLKKLCVHSGRRLTDGGLAHFAELNDLEQLSLVDCRKITDAGLRHLEDLSRLNYLGLFQTNVTGTGVERLSELRILTLGKTPVSREGLECVARLENLEVLSLSDTSTADGDLRQLEGLVKLQKLDINNTPVSTAGVKALRKALPKCRIAWMEAVARTPKWTSIISGTTIEDEIKRVTTALKKDVTSPAAFSNGGFHAARVHLTELTMLFAIIGQYDGDVRWKTDAPAARALFARTAANCKTGSVNAYQEVKTRIDDLDGMLGGFAFKRPAERVDANWRELLSRAALMKRMEQIVRSLHPESAGRSEAGVNQEKVLHHAELIAAVGTIIQQAEMEDAGDEEYASFATALTVNANSLSRAATAKDVNGVRRAMARVTRSCTDCHQDYR
ncbi:MAG: cytochrome c [Pirellulaceae bacterium]|jgi:cytochrome c556|nr:cytochrome c [Pirellulaceae bacterium]MDP7016926.1 cytochrome c [Pirellulaceae bacterium]